MLSPASAGKTGRLGFGLLIGLLLSSCAADRQHATSLHEVAHHSSPLHAVARLKAVSNRGTVYVDRGPVTGTLDMTMTLTVDNATGQGTFRAVAQDGSLTGSISILTGESRVRHGQPVFVFTGTGKIERGKRAYRDHYANHLKMKGEIRTGGVFNMTLDGSLLRPPTSEP